MVGLLLIASVVAALLVVLRGGGSPDQLTVEELAKCLRSAGFETEEFDRRAVGGGRGMYVLDQDRELVELFVADNDEQAKRWEDHLVVDDGEATRVANIVYQIEELTAIAVKPIEECAGH
jgi:hypothetical protein